VISPASSSSVLNTVSDSASLATSTSCSVPATTSTTQEQKSENVEEDEPEQEEEDEEDLKTPASAEEGKEKEVDWELATSRISSEDATKLDQLDAMGGIYQCRPFNAVLLQMYHGDLAKVIDSLNQFYKVKM